MNRVKRIERARAVLGFNDPRAGTHDNVQRNFRAVVQFGLRHNPALLPETARLEDVEVRALYPDGRFLRFVAFGGHVVHDHVLVGGGNFDPNSSRVEESDDNGFYGYYGLWKMQGGNVCLRRDLPLSRAGRAVPEGLYKDLLAPAMSRVSLDYNRPWAVRSSQHAQRCVDAMLSLAEVALAEHVPQEPVNLVAPSMQVGTAGKARFRFLRGWSKMSALSQEMTMHVVERTQSGSWVLPGLEQVFYPGVKYGDIAAVTAITADGVTLTQSDGDVRTWTVPAPVMQVQEYLKRVTGFDATSLAVVSTVKPGEYVGHDTCLFGPATKQFGLTVDQRIGRAHDARGEQVLLAEQLWAALCLGETIEGRTYYPVHYAIPTSSRDVRLKLRNGADGVYLGLQILPLAQHFSQQPSQQYKVAVHRPQLKVREPGLRINVYNCSHRGRIDRAAAERRAREREQLQQPSVPSEA